MYTEFRVHRLSEEGLEAATQISQIFDGCLTSLEGVWGDDTGRLQSIVRTKLEEACFFAKKAVASNPRYRA